MSLGPDWTHINSTHIDAAMYDPEQQKLSIRFKRGHVYHYTGVPQDIADALAIATSPGAYFAENIQEQYPTSRE